MSKKRVKTAGQQSFFDYNLLAVVIILVCFGLVMLYSASSYTDSENILKTGFFKQFIIIAAGLVGAMVLSLFDYHFFIKISPVIYVIALVLMALVPKFGVELNGATRWLKIPGVGLTFMPSEFAKIAIILVMARMILNLGRNVVWKRSLFALLLVVGIQSAAAYKFTQNLSTAVIIAGIGVGLIFVYHPKTRIFLIAFAIAIVLLIIFLYYLKTSYNTGSGGGFRMSRVLVWFDPENFMDAGGYQVMQGLYAIGSGGFFGKGLGNSAQKLSKIPEASNDMIFTIICEELGLFGAILLMIIFGYLLYRLLFIAQNAPDLYGSIIVSGIMFHFAIQIVLNIAVVLNVIPTTGISLPFVSYGGTAVVFLMGEIGLCLSVSRRIRVK